MAQLEVLAHGIAAQVEIAVFHTDIITAVGIVLDGEGRRDAFAQNIELRRYYLDITSGQVLVLAFALVDGSFHLYAEFTSEMVGTVAQFLIDSIIEHQLCDAISVAQVNECHSAHLTSALHPSGKCHHLSGIGES